MHVKPLQWQLRKWELQASFKRFWQFWWLGDYEINVKQKYPFRKCLHLFLAIQVCCSFSVTPVEINKRRIENHQFFLLSDIQNIHLRSQHLQTSKQIDPCTHTNSYCIVDNLTLNSFSLLEIVHQKPVIWCDTPHWPSISRITSVLCKPYSRPFKLIPNALTTASVATTDSLLPRPHCYFCQNHWH